MAVNQQIVSYNKEVEDYLLTLPPGYRFCPSDSELLLYCLKPKIDQPEVWQPKCRIYDVNLYDHHPQELSELYLPSENKWYFLTPRERMYPNGDRPKRSTMNFGYWKTTQKYSNVLDSNGRLVGTKRCLAYYDANDNKLPWLMHEYTINGDKKFSDWVLCKIYKKEMNRSNQVQNARNQKHVIVERIKNQSSNYHSDQPSPIQRRVSVSKESNQLNEPASQIQEGNHNLETDVQMMAPESFMLNSNQQSVYNIDAIGSAQSLSFNPGINGGHTSIKTNSNQVTMQPMALLGNSNMIQQPSFGSSTCEYYHNQSVPSSTAFQFSSGALCSSSMGASTETSTYDVLQLCVQNSYQDTDHAQEKMEFNEDDDPYDEIMALLDDDLRDTH